MSNFIQHGLDRIYREIPTEILNMSFAPTLWGFQQDRSSLEANIRTHVLDGIVLPDVNIVSSNVVEIPLLNMHWEYLDNGIRIRIPVSATGGRHILSILSLNVVNRGLEGMQVTEGTPSGTGTTEVYLVAPNTVWLSTNPGTRYCHLRVSIDNDRGLNNMSPRNMLVFGDLCVLAAKQYIYTKQAININITSMNGGSVDGTLRSIIDDYADAVTMYHEILRVKFRKLSLMGDRKQINRIISLGLGG